MRGCAIAALGGILKCGSSWISRNLPAFLGKTKEIGIGAKGNGHQASTLDVTQENVIPTSKLNRKRLFILALRVGTAEHFQKFSSEDYSVRSFF